MIYLVYYPKSKSLSTISKDIKSKTLIKSLLSSVSFNNIGNSFSDSSPVNFYNRLMIRLNF